MNTSEIQPTHNKRKW